MSLAGIGYVLLYVFVIASTTIAYKQGLTKIGKKPKVIKANVLKLLCAFTVWTGYLYVIGESGVLWNFELPPRFLLLVFLPLIIVMIILFRLNRNSQLYKVIPKVNLIYFQSFRVIVELIILATFLEGIFPIETTFEGYNFEIVVAILAPFVGFAVYYKKWLSERIALLFNWLGLFTLAIIIFIVISALFIPSFWGDNVPEIQKEFTRVPYLLLPGLIAPFAIFVHLFSIFQIKKYPQQT